MGQGDGHQCHRQLAADPVLRSPFARLAGWTGLVRDIRGFLEDKGVSFGADWLGKIKMFLQCIAILWILIALSLAHAGFVENWMVVLRDVLNWSTVAVTFISGTNYVRKAIEHLA